MNVKVTKAFSAVRNGEIYAETIQMGEVVDGALAKAALDLGCGEETEEALTDEQSESDDGGDGDATDDGGEGDGPTDPDGEE